VGANNVAHRAIFTQTTIIQGMLGYAPLDMDDTSDGSSPKYLGPNICF